jgi:hypothetical protein
MKIKAVEDLQTSENILRMVSTFLLGWRYKKNAIFWFARIGELFIPTTIKYLKKKSQDFSRL